jgi:hypothetical protein
LANGLERLTFDLPCNVAAVPGVLARDAAVLADLKASARRCPEFVMPPMPGLLPRIHIAVSPNETSKRDDSWESFFLSRAHPSLLLAARDQHAPKARGGGSRRGNGARLSIGPSDEDDDVDCRRSVACRQRKLTGCEVPRRRRFARLSTSSSAGALCRPGRPQTTGRESERGVSVHIVPAEPEPRVSVRATIAALVRFGIASKDVARVLERDWATYRRQNGLDLFGEPVDPQRPGAGMPASRPLGWR